MPTLLNFYFDFDTKGDVKHGFVTPIFGFRIPVGYEINTTATSRTLRLRNEHNTNRRVMQATN